jgi:hypothetical protein
LLGSEQFFEGCDAMLEQFNLAVREGVRPEHGVFVGRRLSRRSWVRRSWFQQPEGGSPLFWRRHCGAFAPL